MTVNKDARLSYPVAPNPTKQWAVYVVSDPQRVTEEQAL